MYKIRNQLKQGGYEDHFTPTPSNVLSTLANGFYICNIKGYITYERYHRIHQTINSIYCWPHWWSVVNSIKLPQNITERCTVTPPALKTPSISIMYQNLPKKQKPQEAWVDTVHSRYFTSCITHNTWPTYTHFTHILPTWRAPIRTWPAISVSESQSTQSPCHDATGLQQSSQGRAFTQSNSAFVRVSYFLRQSHLPGTLALKWVKLWARVVAWL